MSFVAQNLGSVSSANRRLFSAVVRKNVSVGERAALRAARRERANKFIQEATGVESGATGTASSTKVLTSKYTWYAAVGIPSAILAWGLSDENSPPAQFSRQIGLTRVIEDLSDSYARPAHAKLLPDWSQMPNVPQDIPVPHTLVLDLEQTLVSSTWDRKYGWRHAKRPGVDKFLMDMAQYYEIVLYSPSIDGVADPVVTNLDKNGCIMHRLYREATHYKNGIHVKDIRSLNRNINRIVVLDDDPEEVAFNPENLIKVKPYEDPTDREDNTLERITPFLIEIARENYNDIPGLLRQYQGMDADEIADEQERRVNYFRQAREERLSHGIGGLAKMARRTVDMQPDLEPRSNSFTPAVQQLTSKDLVGAAPPSASQNSGIMGFLNRRQEEKEEQQKRKYEKWNEVMMRKQKEKQEQQK
mmetsp:Transcript_38849/g.93921  ORF Transcript_38849/g.93921 Transcript_38849/m.93921 type:complete len:416 (-) Transcript_38849:43-1290(-)